MSSRKKDDDELTTRHPQHATLPQRDMCIDEDHIISNYRQQHQLPSVGEPERELRRPYEAQTPTKYRKPLPYTAASVTNEQRPLSARTRSPIPSIPNVKIPPPKVKDVSSLSLPRNEKDIATKGPTESVKHHQSPSSDGKQGVLKPKSQLQQSSSHYYHYSSPPSSSAAAAAAPVRHHHEFQRTVDVPSIQVRYVNVQQRSAFLQRSITKMIQEWEHSLATATNTTTITNKLHQPQYRVSPSYNHLRILHRIHNTKMVRQLHFSPSTGLDADYFYTLQQNEITDTSSTRLDDDDDDDERLIRTGCRICFADWRHRNDSNTRMI
jgi:hypothetical protein